MNTLINQMVIQEVRKQLLANTKFAKTEDGYTAGRIFADQVIFRATVLDMSVNEIVTDILTINGAL